jgi:hypothetical protein
MPKKNIRLEEKAGHAKEERSGTQAFSYPKKEHTFRYSIHKKERVGLKGRLFRKAEKL